LNALLVCCLRSWTITKEGK